jgi:hypothetical protein
MHLISVIGGPLLRVRARWDERSVFSMRSAEVCSLCALSLRMGVKELALKMLQVRHGGVSVCGCFSEGGVHQIYVWV